MAKCFADRENYCSALKKKECEGCNFFKTHEDLEKSRDRAIRRIDSLPKSTKDFIYQNCFKGGKANE